MRGCTASVRAAAARSRCSRPPAASGYLVAHGLDARRARSCSRPGTAKSSARTARSPISNATAKRSAPTSIAYLNTEPSVTGGTFGADAVAAIAPTIAEATHVVSRPGPARRHDLRTLGVSHARRMPPIDRGTGGDRSGALSLRRRHAERERVVLRTVRPLPLELRHAAVRAHDQRSGVRVASHDRAALRHRGAAAGRCRRRAVSFQRLRRTDELGAARDRGAGARAQCQRRRARLQRHDPAVRRRRRALRRCDQARRDRRRRGS